MTKITLMYVWLDALSNYITAIGYGNAEKASVGFEKYWQNAVHLGRQGHLTVSHDLLVLVSDGRRIDIAKNCLCPRYVARRRWPQDGQDDWVT